MKTALVVGGTGLVGREVIKLLLDDKRYARVISLGRRPSDITHEKLTQIEFDFERPDASVVKADDIFCCLGTTRANAGSSEAFYKVDYEYVLRVAELAYANGAQRFALVSSLGADAQSSLLYPRTKGEIEAAVSRVGFAECYLLRPSMLLGERREKRLGETVGKVLMNVFAFLIPAKYKAIEAAQVARALLALINSGKPGAHVVESQELAKL